MFNLEEKDIHLSASANNKQQAITQVANALITAGLVDDGYLQGMLAREQQTSTFLGNGIAIPHGTLDTREMVKKTGVQILQFPQGIDWGNGEIAYIVIGIAARSDEHLTLLRQLTHILSDEEVTAQLVNAKDKSTFRTLFIAGNTSSDNAGNVDGEMVNEQNINLDIQTQSLLTLIAVNAGNLARTGAVNSDFVSDIIASPMLLIGNGLHVTDSLIGNKQNALAYSRANKPFEINGNLVYGVISVAKVDQQIDEILSRLLDENVQQILLKGDKQSIIESLKGKDSITSEKIASQEKRDQETSNNNEHEVIGIFTLRNEYGLHARPGTVLINLIKAFNSMITVENLDRNSSPVNAKSMMKIISLGAIKGNNLRFVAKGQDALQLMEAIGAIIANGLGEQVSTENLTIIDEIKIANTPVNNAPASTSEISELTEMNTIEAIFVINNPHGIHARPAALLVNEAKKYNADISVQNLDRNGSPVNAKSMMKIVALGAVKGHRLRFMAKGDDAQQAIENIGLAIKSGLGE